MTHDDELDAYLADRLAAPALAAGDFTRRIVTRLDRRRRWRRGIAAATTAVASVGAGVAMARTPAPLLSAIAIGPESAVAMLVLTALCCAAWIAAEARRSPLASARDARG